MRFCIPVPCFFRGMDFADAIKNIASLGFDAAETYDWRSLDAEKVRNACGEYGVELLSMCTTEFNLTRPEKRDDFVSGVSESCQAAKKMGVKKLITQVGNDTGRERKYQHDCIVRGLRAARHVLEEYGVTLMIEPLNTLVNHPGYYLRTSDEAFEIIREVDSPFVKVVYDIYHQQITEGNIIPNLTQNLDCIAHLHAAGHPGRHELHLGETDYKNVFAAADKAGYTGACGLEYAPTKDSTESLKEFRGIYL